MVKLIKQTTVKLAEKKYRLSTSNGGQTVDATGTVTCISNIPQGDSDEERIGDQIYLRSIEVMWDAVVYDTYNFLRLMIIQWFPQVTDTSGTSPISIANNILFDGTSDVENYNMPYYHDNRYQFRVLYDKTITVNTDMPATRRHHFHITKGFKRKIQYYGSSTTNGMNQIFVIKISDSTAASHPTINSAFKLNFSDI